MIFIFRFVEKVRFAREKLRCFRQRSENITLMEMSHDLQFIINNMELNFEVAVIQNGHPTAMSDYDLVS